MKKCLVISILGMLLFACGDTENLKVSESTINFGDIKQGPPVNKTIIISNAGKENFTILKTAANDPCIDTELSKTSLEPGENAELKISYNSYRCTGKFDKTVTIFTDIEGKEETVIHLLGNVEPVLKLSETSINFGNIKEGPQVKKKITLTNEGKEKITIVNTKTSCACTSVSLSKITLEPGGKSELLITYNTYKYPGKFDKTITIFTGPEGKEETVIHMLGNVDPIPMGVIGMNPRKVDVGELNVNSKNKVQIVIDNEGDAPLTISRIYSKKYNIEYFSEKDSKGIKIEAGQKYAMDLYVTPSEAGRFLDTIFIYSDARNDYGQGYKGLLSGTVK